MGLKKQRSKNYRHGKNIMSINNVSSSTLSKTQLLYKRLNQ